MPEVDAAALTEAPPRTFPTKRRRYGKLLIFLIVLAAAAFGVYLFLRYESTFESTDDAQVEAHLNGLSARVAGTVTSVYVEENQTVQPGQPIADLDPRDYQVALDQARAQLSQFAAQVRAENPNLPITQVTNRTAISTTQSDIANAEAGLAAAERDADVSQADLKQAEANNAKAQADLARYRPLVEKSEVSREQFDQVQATARAQEAVVEARRAAIDAARKTIDQRKIAVEQARFRFSEAQQNAPHQVAIREANLGSRQAAVRTAQTQVERAALDLAYCKIVCPVSGIVSRRTVEVGQRVSVGQQLVQIAQIDDLWVTAQFKETQIHRMRPGQRVTIHIDAFKQDLNGVIESLPASTGSIASVLPPENSTGNYVKVVQRLPVRIRFAKDQKGLERLRPGMSVEPKVWLD